MPASSQYLIRLATTYLTAAIPAAALAQAAPETTTQTAAGPSQDTEIAAGEIVVTARNRRETLQTVPLSITALTAGQIQRQKVETFEDVARLSSSLVFDKGFGLQDTRPVIRGLPSSRGRPAVGILIDGVDGSSESMGASAGGSTLLNTRALDVERIEVVKGPQSALYGRVAFGGAVNYITKKPSHTFGVEASGEIGDYKTYEGRAAITGPLNDAFAFRVNGYHSESDGYFRNNITGNRVGGYNSSGGGASLAFDQGIGHALLSVNYSDDRIEPAGQEYVGSQTGSYVVIPLPAGVAGQLVGVGTALTPLPATSLGTPFGTVTRSGFGVNLSVDPRTGQDYPGAHVKTMRTALHIDLDVGAGVKLTSISAYTDSSFDEREDVDFFARPVITVAGPSGPATAEPGQRSAELDIQSGRVRQLNQEIRIGALDGGPFRWAVGALYWFEKYSQQNDTVIYVVPAPFSAQRDVLLADGSLPNAYGSRTTEHISGYGLLEYDITPKLTVSAEGRYSHESYYYVFTPFLVTSPALNANGFYPVIAAAFPVPQHSATNYFTPKALLRYRPTNDLMVYVSAAEGVKPAGFSTVSTIDSRLAGFGVERLYNYEVGFKGDFLDHKVTLNAAGFYMRYKGKQTSVVAPSTLTASGFASQVLNVGGARVVGLEADLTVQPVRDLILNVGYTYLDAKYTDYVLNVSAGLTGSLVNSCVPNVVIGTGTFCQANLAGNRLERTPRHSLVGFGRYSIPFQGATKLFVEGDVRYTSDRPLDEYGKRFIPPSTTANVRAGIETDHFTLLGYVDNVLNDNAILGAIGVGDTFQPGILAVIVQPPNPRRFGVRGSVKF